MIPFEEKFFSELQNKELSNYTYIDAMVIISEVVSYAKGNIATTRAKTEARGFENIICQLPIT